MAPYNQTAGSKPERMVPGGVPTDQIPSMFATIHSAGATGLVVPVFTGHFWLCPIPFVLEYPNQPYHFSL